MTVPRHFTGRCSQRTTAALRMPLLDCGCHDPMTCRCAPPAILPEATLATVRHLATIGFDGSFAVADLRAAYSLADDDGTRALITRLASRPK
jgi:hypothetical protein